VAAYALYELSIAKNPSSSNPALNYRTNLTASMKLPEFGAAQELVVELARPGNLLKALDRFAKSPGGN
jgi:hypothetical protein